MNARSCLIATILLTFAGQAQAQGRYARPPDGPVSGRTLPADGYAHPPAPDDGWEYPPPPGPESTVRVSVGPALRVGADHTHGGLVTLVDIGSKAAGGRLSGTWSHVGSDGGLSQYTAELWVD